MTFPIKHEAGTSLLEIMISLGLLAVGGAMLLNMGDTSNKQANAIEYKLLNQQYKMQTMSQFLTTAHNCKCLFAGATFVKTPATKIAVAATSTYTSLGFFKPDCSSLDSPFLTNVEGSDGVKINQIQMTDVEYLNNRYYGNLAVTLSSKKEMLGNDNRGFKLPVNLRVKDAAAPGQVEIMGCSMTSGLTDGSPFKLPTGLWSIPLNPSAGNFVFPALPPTASGVYIQYVIGNSGLGRSDRNCDISGAGINVKLGTDSKGDGGQKFVAGSAYVPIDGCGAGSPMRYRCNNSGNTGEFRVVAYIDDGNAPVCPIPQITCAAGDVPDGMGGCVAPSPDGSDCPVGYTYNAALDKCDQNVVSCTNPFVAVNGSCVDMTSVVVP